jgi:hypothetical protein
MPEPTARLHRSRRLAVAAALVVGLLAVPVGVLASHAFSDVPTSHKFHTAIGRVAGAGITAGCGGTKYCPGDAVNRGSMAAFLARSSGRAVEGGVGGSLAWDPGEQTFLGKVDIKAGDVTDGTANVLLNGAIYGSTAGVDGCPCAAVIWVTTDEENILGVGYLGLDTDFGEGTSFDTTNLTAVVGVPSGVTTRFNVYGGVFGGSEDVDIQGTVTAAYFPFDGDGTNATAIETTSIATDERGFPVLPSGVGR